MTTTNSEGNSGITQRIVSSLSWLILIAAIGGILFSLADHGIVYQLVRTDTAPATKIEELRDFFDQFGQAAPAVYVGFVVIEVIVAPLPGAMLYAPGGVIFGPFLGGALSLLGNVLGAGVSCQIVRSFNPRWLNRFFAEEKLEQVQESLERRGSWLVFLLRVNPLTSSDLVSYASGLTRIPVWKVMLATMFGMAPLCFAQAWLADSVLRVFPRLLYPLLVACLIYVVVVVWIIKRLGSTPAVIDESAP